MNEAREIRLAIWAAAYGAAFANIVESDYKERGAACMRSTLAQEWGKTFSEIAYRVANEAVRNVKLGEFFELEWEADR